ncbi:hypothetical protein [Microbacterium ulmi]|uniref:Uncharacterized protein n=1 Tax=Microbacterium ulmi TaxID=179095 RepID=A0A7Y2M0G5_9MICO|nr:hypothetical protein [Microbacterium ulmi]NII69169.1 hypothetical protein [Microbacterium ulmi]NNH03709.1 hypothetical protein [Microbacterium ulmi]
MRMMRATAATVILLSLGALAACMQFGEYAMSSDCESLSDDVVRVVRDELGGGGAVSNMWAGEAGSTQPWCSFTVAVGGGFVDDSSRSAVAELVQQVVDQRSAIVEVTLAYEPDILDVLASSAK